ncbi:MAG: hypothetical protein Rhims3KO_36250 [Hyphomicrobiales bacterium]
MMNIDALRNTFDTARGKVIAGALAAAMTVMPMAGAPGDAKAEDADRYSSANWTPELIEFDKADRAATEYAMTKEGVGILIHVGQDIPNQHIRDADHLGQLFVKRFEDLGENARYFIRQNDAPATGITYHVGHLIVGGHNGTEVRDLQHAWDSAPQAITQLNIARSLAAGTVPSVSPGG